MKKIMNLTLAILALLTVLGLSACKNGDTTTKNSTTIGKTAVVGRPDYSSKADENVLFISAWVAPAQGNVGGNGNPDCITDEQYNLLKESGLTAIYALYENLNSDATSRALALAEKYGIQYYVRDTSTYVDPEVMELEPGEFASKYYAKSSAFAGHLITDEPNSNQFEKIGKLKAYYEQEFPGKDFYINLFPIYATLAQIGESSYEQYISEYIRLVNPDYISLDHYALLEDGYGKKKITEDCLINYEIVAEACKSAGIYMRTFVQSMSYGGSSRCPDEAEIRYQVLMQLAYGSKGIQYFTYQTPIEWMGDESHGTDAMVDCYGNPTERYYYVQQVNKELHGMDEAYLDFDYQGTMVFEGDLGDSTNKCYKQLAHDVKSHEMINSFTCEQDTIIGLFKNDEGRDAFMIVNFEDPANNKSDTIKVEFQGADAAVVYHYGVAEVVELVNGVLNYTLDKGDGIFVIPYKK